MKKVVALLLSFTLLLSLAACGNSTSSTKENSETEQPSHNIVESSSDSGNGAESEDEGSESSQAPTTQTSMLLRFT